ncbi:hypothetical protein Hdeb2414_s0004g00128761 [Helianthus debilis subsp. tardiflorus]
MLVGLCRFSGVGNGEDASTGFSGANEIPMASYDFEPAVTVEPPVVYESKQSDVDLEVATGLKEKQPVISSFASSWKAVKASLEVMKINQPLQRENPPTYISTFKRWGQET